MKKILWLLLIVGMATAEVQSVRQLKVYDNTFRKTPVYQDRWQNLTEQARIEWKEPFGTTEVTEYKYYFGQDQNGALTNTTKKTEFVSAKLAKEGTYYFKIVAVGADKTESPVRVTSFKYDKSAPSNEVVVTVSNGKNGQVLTSAVAQDLTARPFINFDLSKVKVAGAPVKGVDYYFGPDPDGNPDRQVTALELESPKSFKTGELNYLIVALEDEAGNVSDKKVLFTFSYNKVVETPKGSPKVVVLSRQSKLSNTKPGTTDELIPGSVINYQIAIANQGDANAYDLELNDSIPDGTTFVVGTANGNPAVNVEYFDQQLNNGKGIWTMEVSDPATIKKVRWSIPALTPAGDKKVQQDLSYSVVVNQI